MAQKQGISLVGVLHFDGLRTQFHGAKARKIYDQPILGGGGYAPYAPLESATVYPPTPNYLNFYQTSIF
jgi:hypothetical protein